MPSSSTDASKALRAGIDGLAGEIDKFHRHVKNTLESASYAQKEDKKVELYKISLQYDNELESLFERFEDAFPSNADDPSGVRHGELKRLRFLHERLGDIMDRVEPDTTTDQISQQEDNYAGVDDDVAGEISPLSSDEGPQRRVEGQEDSGSQSMRRNDSFKGEASYIETRQLDSIMALYDYRALDEEELTFKKGEVMQLIDTSEGEWWFACNNKGDEGYVPSNYVKVVKRGEVFGESSETDSEYASPVLDTTGPRVGADTSGSPKGFAKLKQAFKKQTPADVLRAFGAMPSGFRPSTLGQLLSSGDKYWPSTALLPRLDSSGQAFKDIFLDNTSAMVRLQSVFINRFFHVIEAKRIPKPGVGVKVLGRSLKVCLFDKTKFIGNVHIFRAFGNNDNDNWQFDKGSFFNNVASQNNALIRTNCKNTNLSLLLELCFTYVRESSNEEGEMSCGWAILPLFVDGNLIESKTYVLKLRGGTPYEPGVPLDGTNLRADSTNPWERLIGANKMPRIYVRLSNFSRTYSVLSQTLPETIVCSTASMKVMSLYREVMADALLKNVPNPGYKGPRYNPVMQVFPHVCNQKDILESLTQIWNVQFSKLKRSQKRNPEVVKKLFKDVLLQKIWPLVYAADLKPSSVGQLEVEQERSDYMTAFLQNTPTDVLCSNRHTYRPFHIDEVSYSILDSCNYIIQQ
eukprot:Nk52_evm11s256 gene=Nk52_evmTU11s256